MRQGSGICGFRAGARLPSRFSHLLPHSLWTQGDSGPQPSLPPAPPGAIPGPMTGATPRMSPNRRASSPGRCSASSPSPLWMTTDDDAALGRLKGNLASRWSTRWLCVMDGSEPRYYLSAASGKTPLETLAYVGGSSRWDWGYGIRDRADRRVPGRVRDPHPVSSTGQALGWLALPCGSGLAGMGLQPVQAERCPGSQGRKSTG